MLHIFVKIFPFVQLIETFVNLRNLLKQIDQLFYPLYLDMLIYLFFSIFVLKLIVVALNRTDNSVDIFVDFWIKLRNLSVDALDEKNCQGSKRFDEIPSDSL